MKATVDPDLCTGCGVCVESAPEVFDLTDEGLAEAIVDAVPDGLAEAARQAADDCPVEAILIKD